jgi:hypothetical protein
MKTKYGLFAASMVILFLAAGCSSLTGTLASTTGLVDQTKARINQAAMDAIGLGDLEDAVLASLIYSQVFFAGGYGSGYDDFDEGEGVTWDVTFRDEDGSEIVRIERALLRRNNDGTAWWLLRYAAEDEEDFLSEAMIGDEYDLLKFRYLDPETNTLREWVPAEEEEADTVAEEADDETEEEPVDVGFYQGAYDEYMVGSERITVPAGTYQADHILIEDTYTEDNGDGTTTSYSVTYEWWINEEVPGDLVKYSWNNTTDSLSISGELVSTRKGYTTELDSF